MYDAIVVGARAAGSPTAMLLARKGHRVLLLDRAEFPSDTLSTHYIHQPGVARLARWGLLDQVIASGCPPVRQVVFDPGPFTLTGAPLPVDGHPDAYAPRRLVLDAILLEAAAAAGAEVRTGFSVDELVFDDGAVVGVRHGEITERARVVVGADGRNSFVARAVRARADAVHPGLACAYYTYWAGVEGDAVELCPREGRMVMGGASTNDGLKIVIVFWPREEFDAVRADVERNFDAALALAPRLADRLAKGERAERFYGIRDLPFYYRKSFGPGWALVGDAGYHKDPITAQGISDAFRHAELLCDAFDAAFTAGHGLDDALARYERIRNEETRPLYELTREFAMLAAPAPEQQALFAALRDQPDEVNRFLGVVAGTVPVGEFFAPDNLARILGEAVPA